MATLVLTTVGTLIGWPIGGAVGAVLGQQVDQRLFAPKGRQGPRLNDLAVQTSNYGSPIPKLFGRMRVAGTVIWATDLIEERHSSGGGKSGPKTTTYSYSASFAVALSARPIRAVHRIWADGKLLRGAAGDWKSETEYRLYLGTEDQGVDPLIASAEGSGGAPAYRGVAYALFEDFQLADYGNHIPSITFEVEADEGPVSIGTIAEALAAGDVAGETGAAVGGYAASGDSVRGAIDTLAAVAPLSVIDDGAVLRLSDTVPEAVVIGADEQGARADGRPAARIEMERHASGALPDEVGIAYYEPTRDYQAGLQRARRGGPGRRVDKIDLPAALTAEEAKGFAERRLAESWAGRMNATLTLPWRRMGLRPGGHVALGGSSQPWRVAGLTIDRMVAELKLAGVASASASAVGSAAAPGRAVHGADEAHGATRLALLDLPPLDTVPVVEPRLWVAACGDAPGWRRAALSISLDDGASWTAIGTTAPPAVMGVATGVLASGSAALFDRRASVEVELAHEGMWLESRDDRALVGGANLAMLGDELIQFGRAESSGPGRFLLSGLLRGRRGTEWAMAGHAAGEDFVLIEAATLRPIDLGREAIGSVARIMAVGVGDAEPVEVSVAFAARALRPPAPVHIRCERLADGTIRFRWTRRSRAGWPWLDGADAPLGEESEVYRLMIEPSLGLARAADVTGPLYDYGPAEQAADGSAGADAVTVTIAQRGTIAPSQPGSSMTFTL